MLPTIKRGLVSAETAAVLSSQFQIFAQNIIAEQANGSTRFGDDVVPNSFSWYGAFTFDGLLPVVQGQIEFIVGRPLLPTYSYARIYCAGAELKEHTDRNESEIAVSLAVETGGIDWPLCFRTGESVSSVVLQNGDAVIYDGCNTPHWRRPLTARQYIQAFLFYVFADGTRAGRIFDGRKMLGASGCISTTG